MEGGGGRGGSRPLKAAAGGGSNRGGHVIDPAGEFGPGITAKQHNMDCANPRAGQHGNGRLDHGWHSDQDTVTFFHTQRAQAASEPGHPVL